MLKTIKLIYHLNSVLSLILIEFVKIKCISCILLLLISQFFAFLKFELVFSFGWSHGTFWCDSWFKVVSIVIGMSVLGFLILLRSWFIQRILSAFFLDVTVCCCMLFSKHSFYLLVLVLVLRNMLRWGHHIDNTWLSVQSRWLVVMFVIFFLHLWIPIIFTL